MSALAGAAASGSASLALPVVSSRPCVMALAAIPAPAGIVVLRLRGRALRVAGTTQRAR